MFSYSSVLYFAGRRRATEGANLVRVLVTWHVERANQRRLFHLVRAHVVLQTAQAHLCFLKSVYIVILQKKASKNCLNSFFLIFQLEQIKIKRQILAGENEHLLPDIDEMFSLEEMTKLKEDSGSFEHTVRWSIEQVLQSADTRVTLDS